MLLVIIIGCIQFSIFCSKSRDCIVTDDPGLNPDQKYARRRDRQNYIQKDNLQFRTWNKRIPLYVQYIGTCVGADFKVIGKFMTVFIVRRDAACS